LNQSQQGEVQFSGEGHERWDNSSEATISSWLRQHQNWNSPGGEGIDPAALTAFINTNITIETQQSQAAGIADL